MGNRKKMKDNRLRLKKNPNILSRGIARLREEDRGVPTHDEMFPGLPPEDEAVVIKEVPAKVDGVTVGVAYIHDDGSVAIKYDADAPKWAIDKINATAVSVGYNLVTGESNGPA